MEFSEMFSNFDPVPIGVGAIAQVYRCKLSDMLLKKHGLNDRNSEYFSSKEELALKILHPNASFHVHTDLLILNMAVSALEFVFSDLKWLSLSEESAVFGSMMKGILFYNLSPTES
jgi:aarF domain-containing kinase